MTDKINNPVKVLVVDDSAFMRKVICDILNMGSGIRVIGSAKDGKEALEMVETLKPDVITLDIEMPVMDGLSCLREMIKNDYVNVIILSSLTKEGAEATIQALEYGAVDFITKPTNIFDMKNESKKQEIIDKVKLVGGMKKNKKDILPAIQIKNIQEKKMPEIAKNSSIKSIVAIGTSTGGPKALQVVLPLIPGDIPAAFLVVQHMPPGFTKSLAGRLDSMSEITVKEAEDREIVKAGHAYLAPGDFHMLVEKQNNEELRIKLSKMPPVGGHRPAVNVMMESLSQTELSNIIAVIMTGMGGDGSKGIKMIKDMNKGYVIAQDEKTCVVYGMPKVAVQTGAVDVVVPLHEITNEIMKFMGVQK